MCENWEGLGKVISHHSTKFRQGTCFGSVYLLLAVVDDIFDRSQVLVLFVLFGSKMGEHVGIWLAVVFLIAVDSVIESQLVLSLGF